MKTVSFSALESYKNCPRLFKFKYVDKIKYEKTLERPLLVGSWAHELIEEKLNYKDTNIGEIFRTKFCKEWIVNAIPEMADEAMLIKNVKDVLIEMSNVLYRASSKCKDPNLQIRNNDGSVPKDPVGYPPGSFREACKDIKNLGLKSELDNLAAKYNPVFVSMSLSWMLAEALTYGLNFAVPNWVQETLGVELEFGTNETNQVKLGDTDCSLLGYIDWKFLVNDGQVGVVDHKTSTKKPTPAEVLYHPQLNLYAYATEVLYGTLPDIIGINHVKSGELVLVNVDPHIVYETVSYYTELYKSTANDQVFIKRHPNDYQSPCIKRDFRTNKIISSCPMFESCWKSFGEFINEI